MLLQDLIAYLEQIAPPRLAADWDNVGLLVGDAARPVARAMTCLTLTPASVAEALAEGADLVITHHPLPFHAVKRLTTATPGGRMLLDLIGARIAVYSPHTAWDSAERGINQRLAEGLGLTDIAPLLPDPQALGVGRLGRFLTPLALPQLAERVRQFLAIERLQWVGDPEQPVRRVAVTCGAADDLLEAAREADCDALVLGEARFHACLEAEAYGIGLILPGHFASERFAQECLARMLAEQFPPLTVWASRQERDPLRWLP